MNDAIKNILIPLDFTRKNEKFLHIAAAVANRHGAKVHVLNVIPFSLLGTGSVSSGKFFFYGNAMIESAEKQLATYKMVMRKITNEDVIAQHAIGSVATQVLKYSKQKNIDLILMPVQYPKKRPGFISSNTYEIIANSAVPVMTIPENFNKEKFEKILFPIRNVKAVEDKLQSVMPIAKKNKANVRLVAIDAFKRKSSIRNLENKVQLFGEKLHNSEISTINPNHAVEIF
ncbi:universal stress protein [Flavobacterium sp.]|uniref:universal stress protein n=1 Tax=Flavobacterium sp. TaxID=239 RepID=UPI0035B08532